MIYTIENDKVKVAFSDIGGEMQSLVLKSTGKEYLWQGDAKYWSGRAYNLFPICGRLTDGKYTYKGNTYEMVNHGFLRSSVMQAEQKSSTEISFILKPNDVIKAQYPFDFVYTVTYILEDTKVKTVYDIQNTGNETMYFGVGGHPGFNVPINDGECFEDYYLEFDCVKPMKRIIMTPLYLTGKTESYAMTDGKIIELTHSLFDEDARFFTDMCKYVTLKSKKSESFVRMEYPEMRNLGIWHAPRSDAPYICIEPWSSLPAYDGKVDDLPSKYQMESLTPNNTFTSEFDIIIG